MSINALSKGLQLLQCFSANAPAWGVTELSLRLGLHKSRVHRILQTLVKARFLTQDPTSFRYQLGWELVHLAQTADPHYPLRMAARPHLARLRDRTKGTVYLRVISGGSNLIIETVESCHPLRLVQPPGTRHPAHFGASGKVLLAFGPEDVRDAALTAAQLERFTPRTLVNRDAFLRELDRVRRRGYAYTNEEAVAGVRSVAAPVLSPGGTAIAAISSALPTHAIPLRAVPTHARSVINCAKAVSRTLFARASNGGSPSPERLPSTGQSRDRRH
jgi:DNA-binding IclR family transcriptional regulator